MKQIKAAIPFLMIVVIALILVFVWRSGSTSTSTQSPSSAAPRWGVQTKTSGCVAHGGLQDSACTPGAIFPNVTRTQVCTPGYASSVRDVPQSVKNKVYAEYGITKHLPGQYEVDHLVSLQLGGSNDIANLWPEAASPRPGFHEKDKVENYLNSQICSGAISLQQAQIEIATNWLAVYNRLPKKALAVETAPWGLAAIEPTLFLADHNLSRFDDGNNLIACSKFQHFGGAARDSGDNLLPIGQRYHYLGHDRPQSDAFYPAP